MRIVGRQDPKPCPVCYAPMVLVDGKHECPKHGTPGSTVVKPEKTP